MKQTTTIQKTKNGFYINIPKKIAEALKLEKGEIALIEFIDEDNLKIQIID